jgi:hypothetical protein
MEQRELRVSEKRMLRIFGLKGKEVAEGCRQFHDEELHNL